MSGIIDVIVIVIFVALLAVFIIGFNRQMLAKQKERLEESKKYRKNKKNEDNKSEDDIND
jgi:uncharacterized membrane protein YqiK